LPMEEFFLIMVINVLITQTIIFIMLKTLFLVEFLSRWIGIFGVSPALFQTMLFYILKHT